MNRLCSLIVCVMALTATVVAAQVPVFRASVDAVTVGVSVRRGNRPVTGLTVKDFSLSDNGVAQEITALSYERLPVDTTVLFDVSGSVTGPVMEQLRRAMVDLRRNLRADDRVRLVTFNMRIRQVLGLDAPASAVDAAFGALSAGGSSAVVDALAVALASGSAPERRQLIVLFSDGKDSISISTPDELRELARATTPTVSVVLATPTRLPFHQVFDDVAAETGGTVVSLLPTESLGTSLQGALEQFRSSYVLTYSPSGVSTAGAHAIAVRVNRPDVDVRARRGYVVR